jgi:putative DNA primase/helicase
MAESSDKIGFLQRLLGMCLTGDISEQKLFIFWGEGGNGKNTLLEAVDGVLGDYSTLAAPDLLIQRKYSEHKTEIADLAGRRLVAASESGEGRRLNENFVKNLTGDNKLKGRYIGRDFFEFPRTFKLILRTNHRPHIRETTYAIWRRISLVPFTVIIPSEEQDKKLGDKLKAEYPGILNWLLEGCLDWQHNGLQEPLEVRQATEEYQSEQDPIAEFLGECLFALNARIARTRLYAAYLSWAQRNSEPYPLRRKDFYAHLRGKGYTEETAKVEGKSERIFRGIALPEWEKIDV